MNSNDKGSGPSLGIGVVAACLVQPARWQPGRGPATLGSTGGCAGDAR